MAGRRNPFEELEEMLQRMSRQFEESMGGSELGQLAGGGAAVDVADRGDEYVVSADLPGYRKADIDVSLRGDQLHIRAEREDAAEESEAGRYLRKERRHRSVDRSVSLPEPIDEEDVAAECRNGVLTVTLPKQRAGGGDSHQIDIS